MSDIDGSTRGENGENAWIIESSSVCGVVLYLGADSKSGHAHFSGSRTVIYLSAVEQRARASGIGDAEGVFRERV